VPLVVVVIATALIAAITLCWVLNIGSFAIVYSSSSLGIEYTSSL
jgi:hypothetical protein